MSQNEEKKVELNKVLKNVQEIHENFNLEDSTLNNNLRVPSRQSVKTIEHSDKFEKKALSNALQVNENIQEQEAKIDDNLRMDKAQKV